MTTESFSSAMQQQFTSSYSAASVELFTRLPSDILKYIMRFLARHDLVSFAMTCTAIQKIFSGYWMPFLAKQGISKFYFQWELFLDVFRYGSFPRVVWFQNTLKYPNYLQLDRQLWNAAKGIFSDRDD